MVERFLQPSQVELNLNQTNFEWVSLLAQVLGFPSHYLTPEDDQLANNEIATFYFPSNNGEVALTIVRDVKGSDPLFKVEIYENGVVENSHYDNIVEIKFDAHQRTLSLFAVDNPFPVKYFNVLIPLRRSFSIRCLT